MPRTPLKKNPPPSSPRTRSHSQLKDTQTETKNSMTTVTPDQNPYNKRKKTKFYVLNDEQLITKADFWDVLSKQKTVDVKEFDTKKDAINHIENFVLQVSIFSQRLYRLILKLRIFSNLEFLLFSTFRPHLMIPMTTLRRQNIKPLIPTKTLHLLLRRN